MTYPNTITFWTAEEGLALIGDWARQGLSNAQIAQRAGVTPRTLSRWRRQSPALEAALVRGRDWANAAVEGALLRRALGYTAVEVTEEETSTGLKTKTSEKHIPGDLSAQMYWLKTRRPDTWGERAANQQNGLIGEIVEAVKQLG